MKYSLKIEEAKEIAEWYQKNKRQLPWRDTNNPYDVWLSETMLQQTRIEAVKPKFLLFKQALPTIQDLANCEDDALMRLWEGLGYYSRARNLKKCAIALVEHYNAQLPEEYKALLKLLGIGPGMYFYIVLYTKFICLCVHDFCRNSAYSWCGCFIFQNSEKYKK